MSNIEQKDSYYKVNGMAEYEEYLAKRISDAKLNQDEIKNRVATIIKANIGKHGEQNLGDNVFVLGPDLKTNTNTNNIRHVDSNFRNTAHYYITTARGQTIRDSSVCIKDFIAHKGVAKENPGIYYRANKTIKSARERYAENIGNIDTVDLNIEEILNEVLPKMKAYSAEIKSHGEKLISILDFDENLSTKIVSLLK